MTRRPQIIKCGYQIKIAKRIGKQEMPLLALKLDQWISYNALDKTQQTFQLNLNNCIRSVPFCSKTRNHITHQQNCSSDKCKDWPTERASVMSNELLKNRGARHNSHAQKKKGLQLAQRKTLDTLSWFHTPKICLLIHHDISHDPNLIINTNQNMESQL
jgi:hypothetical protein